SSRLTASSSSSALAAGLIGTGSFLVGTDFAGSVLVGADFGGGGVVGKLGCAPESTKGMTSSTGVGVTGALVSSDLVAVVTGGRLSSVPSNLIVKVKGPMRKLSLERTGLTPVRRTPFRNVPLALERSSTVTWPLDRVIRQCLRLMSEDGIHRSQSRLRPTIVSPAVNLIARVRAGPFSTTSVTCIPETL